jgi:hypothetical protein
MAYSPKNPNGQATMANSEPVVIASNQSALPVNNDYVSTSGTATTINNDLFPSTDVGKYRTFSFQVSGTWSGTISFQGSNDETTWYSVGVQIANQPLAGSLVTSVGTNSLVYGPVAFRYLRIRATNFSSGTASGVTVLFTGDYPGSTTGMTILSTLVGSQVSHDGVDSAGQNPHKIGYWSSNAEIAAVSADGDRVNAWGDRRGRLLTVQKSYTSTLSNVAGSATSVTVLSANTARLGATFYNDSSAIAYLKLGATASTTSFTVKMFQDEYYELPFGYVDVVDCIWDSATGNMRVNELT